MGEQQGSRAGLRRAVVIVALSMAGIGAAHAQAPELPPSAQPGAAQPRDLTSPLRELPPR